MTPQNGFASPLFISGSIAFLLIGVIGTSYGIAVPALARAFSIAEGTAGLVVTANSLGATLTVALMTLGVINLTTRAALVLVAAGGALIAAGAGWALTLAGAVVCGLGYGVIAVRVNRDFMLGFGARGPGMVALVNGISGIGSVIAPLIWLAAGSRPGIMYTVIAGLALLTLPLFRTAPVAGAEEARPTGTPRFTAGRVGFISLNGLSCILESSISGFAAAALLAMDTAPALTAQLVSAYFAAFLIARLSLYFVARLIAPEWLFLIGTIGTAASMALALTLWTAGGYVAAGAFVGIAFPSFYVWGNRVLHGDARMMSAILMAGLMGWVVGPVLFGALLDRLGMEQLFAGIAIGAAALAVVILAVILRTGRTPAPIPAE